jgi:hypothetical protein
MLARRRSLTLALIAVAGVFAGLAASAAERGVAAYRWVDENGVVHYGDHVPAKYATKESTLINKNGIEIGRTNAQMTPDEIAEEARKRQEVLRQKQHDAFLLTTYTSVKDIESLRDERLFQISGQRHAAEQYIEGLHSRLNGLQSRAKAFKPYSDKPDARRMPDDLAEDLARTLNEMRSQRSALAAKDAEETALRQQFNADIERYRELKKPVTR